MHVPSCRHNLCVPELDWIIYNSDRNFYQPILHLVPTMIATLPLLTALLGLSSSVQGIYYPRQVSSSATDSASLASASSTASSTSSSSISSSSTASSDSDAFPTDVGYAGTIKYGQSPFLAATGRINGSLGDEPIETRQPTLDNAEPFDIFKNVGNEVSWEKGIVAYESYTDL